jgi:hypothetical protein
MTVGIASARANSILDSEYGTAYVQLHTADPGAAGGTAISAGSSTRLLVTWAGAASGSKASSAVTGTWTNGGTSETISHISLWSASSAGTFNRSIAVTTPKLWASADTITIASGALTVAFTPLAA